MVSNFPQAFLAEAPSFQVEQGGWEFSLYLDFCGDFHLCSSGEGGEGRGSRWCTFSCSSALHVFASYPSEPTGDYMETNLECSGWRRGIGIPDSFIRLLLFIGTGTVSRLCGLQRGGGWRMRTRLGKRSSPSFLLDGRGPGRNPFLSLPSSRDPGFLDENGRLLSPSYVEIWYVLWSMEEDKVPGPDGFPPLFFRRY